MVPSIAQAHIDPNTSPVRKYQRPPQTKEELDWAPLVELDISRFDEPGEKPKLAAELEEAVRNVGFWIVTGHGITDEEVLRQLAIATAFYKLPMEEKAKVHIDLANNLNWGYREPVRDMGPTGLKECVESYEIHKDIPALKHIKEHPFVEQHLDEIAPFHRKVFERVARPLYILIAIILELPEDYFLSRNDYEKRSGDWLRWMLNPPRTREYHDAVEPYIISGHTDNGSITLLFEQNVAGLQMLTTDGSWKWVKPVHGGITVNAGELFSHMTGGYVKATVHKVVAPLDDQLHAERLGLIYFAMMGDDTVIRPCPSPKLLRLGVVTKEALEKPDSEYPTAVEYTMGRLRARHLHTQFKKRDDQEYFVLKGLRTRMTYNN